MAIASQDYERATVIMPQGDLTGDDALAIKKVVDESIERRATIDHVIDLANCHFIDSQGLEALLWVKRRCDQMESRIKLANLDENLRKILEMTRLEFRFEICRDLASAFKTLR